MLTAAISSSSIWFNTLDSSIAIWIVFWATGFRSTRVVGHDPRQGAWTTHKLPESWGFLVSEGGTEGDVLPVYIHSKLISTQLKQHHY